MNDDCPNCAVLCTICQDNTWNWHEPLCSSCRLAVAHERDRIIKLLEAECDCDFYNKYEIPSKCVAHRHISVIKGEK